MLIEVTRFANDNCIIKGETSRMISGEGKFMMNMPVWDMGTSRTSCSKFPSAKFAFITFEAKDSPSKNGVVTSLPDGGISKKSSTSPVRILFSKKCANLCVGQIYSMFKSKFSTSQMFWSRSCKDSEFSHATKNQVFVAMIFFGNLFLCFLVTNILSTNKFLCNVGSKLFPKFRSEFYPNLYQSYPDSFWIALEKFCDRIAGEFFIFVEECKFVISYVCHISNITYCEPTVNR